MKSWDSVIAGFRTSYVQSSLERVAAMRDDLGGLRGDAGDRESLENLLRNLHKFAGSGRTYGFPNVTRLARDGEVDVETRLSSGGVVGEDELEAWAQIVDRIEAIFREAERETADDDASE